MDINRWTDKTAEDGKVCQGKDAFIEASTSTSRNNSEKTFQNVLGDPVLTLCSELTPQQTSMSKMAPRTTETYITRVVTDTLTECHTALAS